MKIKKIGWTTFLLNNDNISVLTDPLSLVESGKLFPKTKADVCLYSNYSKKIKKNILEDNKLNEKITADKRETVMEIISAGEYEIGGLMIRRDVGDKFFIIDEKSIRIIYMGGTDNDFNPDDAKNLGDVDVLIMPVGDGVNFMDFDKIEKVISYVDPAILIPCAYQEDSNKNGNLKSKEEFIKHFGFANVREENYININKKKVEEEQKSVEVIFLQ
jgi:hypothetical protein